MSLIKNSTKVPLKILVLQGVPASGKSTFARSLVLKDKSYVIVSRDAIREARGDYWIPEHEDYISDIEEFEIRSAIKHNLNPIIDATNLNPKTIAKWKNLAEELNVNIEFKMFEIDFATALERDSKRERCVGKKVLERFFRNYFPDQLKVYYTDDRLKGPFYLYNDEKEDCIIADLDGTVCLHDGRNPYDLTRVSEDIPNYPLVQFLKELICNKHIIFLSGREETNQCRQDTINWLTENICSPDFGYKWELLMRDKNNFEPDEIIKERIFHKEIEPKYNVIAVFDDRNKVVKMWRSLGLLCNQVYWGNF